MIDEHPLKLIVAVNQLSYIGRDDKLLWYSPDDLSHFKKMTLGCKLLVGRKTFESLPPLKNRELIVVGNGYYSLDEALKQKPDWVIGGESIYNQVIHLVDEFHISVILDWKKGDKSFRIPDDLLKKWTKLVSKKKPVPVVKLYYFETGKK